MSAYRDMPCWVPQDEPEYRGFARVSSQKAQDAGLALPQSRDDRQGTPWIGGRRCPRSVGWRP